MLFRSEGLAKAVTRLLYSLMEAGVDLASDPVMLELAENDADL